MRLARDAEIPRREERPLLLFFLSSLTSSLVFAGNDGDGAGGSFFATEAPTGSQLRVLVGEMSTSTGVRDRLAGMTRVSIDGTQAFATQQGESQEGAEILEIQWRSNGDPMEIHFRIWVLLVLVAIWLRDS